MVRFLSSSPTSNLGSLKTAVNAHFWRRGKDSSEEIDHPKKSDLTVDTNI
jgi:hypothetical protein